MNKEPVSLNKKCLRIGVTNNKQGNSITLYTYYGKYNQINVVMFMPTTFNQEHRMIDMFCYALSYTISGVTGV